MEGTHVQREWENWSGSIRCTPRVLACPDDEPALRKIVGAAADAGRHVRAAGAGHSSSAVVGCRDVLVDIRRLAGILRVDAPARRATVRAGTTLASLGSALYAHDLALPNYGDTADQTIAGALCTATHGAGLTLPSLSSLLVGARLVDGQGRTVDIGESDLHALRSLRVSLGLLGIFVEVTLRLVPAFDVERREYSTRCADALADFRRLAEGNYSFDLYWYPRRDDVKLRLVNPLGGGSPPPANAVLLELRGGPGHEVIPAHSGLPHRFEECEYAMPYEEGLACFADVRTRILRRWRHLMGWRVLVRTVAADDSHLSPHHGRNSITLSIHQNARLPWREIFDDIEPIFRAHGGRPHWAKKHSLGRASLERLYPGLGEFHALRRRLDPADVFLSPPVRRLVGDGRDG